MISQDGPTEQVKVQPEDYISIYILTLQLSVTFVIISLKDCNTYGFNKYEYGYVFTFKHIRLYVRTSSSNILFREGYKKVRV